MFTEETKVAIVDQLGHVAGIKVEDANIELMFAVADEIEKQGIAEVNAGHLAGVKVEVDGKKKSLTANQAEKIFAAIEFHRTVAVSTKTVREKSPTKLEEYIASTTVEERDDIAHQVAELRINAEGTRPRAWRSIREELGLRNEEFHQLIRKSEGWKVAVYERILDLQDQEGGWTYSGKLEVLTGIDGFEMSDVEAYAASLQ